MIVKMNPFNRIVPFFYNLYPHMENVNRNVFYRIDCERQDVL